MMNAEMTEKPISKSKILGIRLDEEMKNRIEEISRQKNIKKSKLLKIAFNEWVRIKEAIQSEDMVLVDSLLLNQLFEGVSEEKISIIAENMANHISSMIRIRQIELEKEEKLNNFLNIFTRVIGQTHFGWVNRVKYKLRKDGSLYVYGLHYYNKEYSLYLKALFGNLLKHYEYKLVEDKCSLTNKTVILEFEPYKI